MDLAPSDKESDQLVDIRDSQTGPFSGSPTVSNLHFENSDPQPDVSEGLDSTEVPFRRKIHGENFEPQANSFAAGSKTC